MLLSPLMIVVGLLGVALPFQWRRSRWLRPGRWIVRTFSPHAVVAVPVLGGLAFALGLSILWPPAVALAFLAAVVLVVALVASVYGHGERRLPRALLQPRSKRPAA